MTPEELAKKIKLIQDYEYYKSITNSLPHLYGFPWYRWAKDYFDSTNKATFLCAANQLSKSSTQIRKMIDWATDQSKWKKLWPNLLPGQKPNQFWAFYPTQDVWQTEFETKWVPDFLPRNKDDQNYGWKEYKDKGLIKKIEFNSGVTIYCKSYAQKVKDLQSGSVHALWCFTAGTKVLTDNGIIPIESLKIGDKVLTRKGFREIENTSSRDALVYKKEIPKKETLESTPEHPIWVNGQWVEFKDITKDDLYFEVPFWQLIKKLSFLKEQYLRDSQSQRQLIVGVVSVAEEWVIELSRLAIFVKKNFYTDKMQRESFVQKPVLTEALETKRVYNIRVQGEKEFFANGILVHNCDEETPVEFIPELQARLRATEGYFHAVMTPTLGQEFWRRIFEPRNKDEELYPNAHKQTISLYDSQKYLDGKPSRWTDERIKEIISECGTEADVQRRVFGRFVKSENLRFESFDLDRNMIQSMPIPKSWGVFAGVDPGSGGKSGHPAAILFLAVRPDYKEAHVFKCWRGDGIPTANTDILKKFRELKGNMLTMAQVYDYKDKDFFLVAQSEGEPFQMANKSRDEGYGLLNSLFKQGMLKLHRGDPEIDKLAAEIMSLSVTGDKRKSQDDLCDALRYVCLTSIPWDFQNLESQNAQKFNDPPPDSRTDTERANEELLKARRDFVLNITKKTDDYNEEINFWNELAGND
jgi:Hint domain